MQFIHLSFFRRGVYLEEQLTSLSSSLINVKFFVPLAIETTVSLASNLSAMSPVSELGSPTMRKTPKHTRISKGIKRKQEEIGGGGGGGGLAQKCVTGW